jgi:hypothetical protein
MKVLVLGAVAVLALTVGLGAQQTTDAKPPAKSAKPAAVTPTIVGHWKMVIETSTGGTQEVTLNLFEPDGKKLTGTMTGQYGRQDIVGEFNSGKFKFSIEVMMGGNAIDVDFDGKLKSDDTLSGSVNIMSAMTMDWKATRIKDDIK